MFSFSELPNQIQALQAGTAEMQAAAQSLQSALEKNQSLNLLIEQQNRSLVENQKLIAMLSNHVLAQHYQNVELDRSYADQRQVAAHIAGELENAHIKIGQLQGGKV